MLFVGIVGEAEGVEALVVIPQQVPLQRQVDPVPSMSTKLLRLPAPFHIPAKIHDCQRHWRQDEKARRRGGGQGRLPGF